MSFRSSTRTTIFCSTPSFEADDVLAPPGLRHGPRILEVEEDLVGESSAFSRNRRLLPAARDTLAGV